RIGRQLRDDVLAAVVSDGELEVEGAVRCAAQGRQLGRDGQIGRQLFGQGDVQGQGDVFAADATHQVERIRPDLRLVGNVKFELERNPAIAGGHGRADRLAAAQPLGLPALGQTVDVQLDNGGLLLVV